MPDARPPSGSGETDVAGDGGTDTPVDDAEPADPTACPYPDYETGHRASVAVDDLPATGAGASGVEARVFDALSAVEDPEMPVSVVDLGLIYGVAVADGHATVEMTLTYTGCPARQYLLDEIETAAASVEGVETANVRLVWTPEWTLEMVTDDGHQALREFGVSV